MDKIQKRIIKNSKLFDEYLVNFQQDIRRIVGKFKKSFHALTDEEVYSECNMHLLKNKDKIVESFESNEMSEADFKKVAYHYCKNEAVWSHYRFTNKSYNRRKLDGVTNTDDGPKTTFELAIDTLGEENEDLDNDYDHFQQIAKKFLHVLTEYSYLLTESEVKVLSYVAKGWNQDKIGEHLGITHQAISHSMITMQEKLNAYFDFNEIMNSDGGQAIPEGTEALNSFFSNTPSPKISNQDKSKIKDFLYKHPKKYKCKDINKILFNNKFTNNQIGSCIAKAKLNCFLDTNFKFTEYQKKLALELFLEGKTSKEVCELLGSPIVQTQCLRGHLVKQGKLNPTRQPKNQ